jgi:hypothetical protein
MKSIADLGTSPAGLPVVSEDLLELHAARILLLCQVCGIKNKVEGLTKLAKLDFFVRYPEFFHEVCTYLGHSMAPVATTRESGMVRFHYGPWDSRYYQVLAYLEGRRLITVSKSGSAFQFTLTTKGRDLAQRLRSTAPFIDIVAHMKLVKKVLGSKTGSGLKTLVYKVFSKEIAEKTIGEAIY